MNVDQFKKLYPAITDENFQQEIFNKTEFSILKKENTKIDNIYFNFQRNIARLLSPVTPYKKMIFFYAPGTGKGCSSILSHELIKAFEADNFRQTVVVTKGRSLQESFIAEYTKRCPGIENNFPRDEQGKVRDILGIKREINKNFIFKRYGAFGSEINGTEKKKGEIVGRKTDEWIRTNYSNRTFIFDEIQVLKNGGKSYKAIQRLIDVAENLTLIGLSGTPNTDRPSEGVVLVNLFKPIDERMKIGSNGRLFLRKYYDGQQFKEEYKEELLKFYNGYVTYLEQTSDIDPTVYEENPEHPSNLTDFKLYEVEMMPFQQSVYKKALETTHKSIKKLRQEGQLDLFARDEQGNLLHYESKSGGVFYRLARDAAQFTYPDETYGAKGFKENIVKEKNKIRFKNKETETEIIKNIRKYSASYAESFDIIKNEPDRVFFLYFENVQNSGLLLYALLLEKILGFSQTDEKTSDPSSRPKYVRIDGTTSSKVSQILNKVSDPRNTTGKIVRVILSSPVGGVGINVPNATRLIVFDSQFTPYDVIQIVNRINRPGSLKYLEEQGLQTDCKAYLMTSITNTGQSIDRDIYEIAQEKMTIIKPQNELMQQADPFCAISALRNGTKECFTAQMRKGKFRREPDTSTDVLYWRQDEITALRNQIIEMVKKQPVIITDLLKDHEDMIVYRTVKSIVEQNKVIENGVIFLSGDLIYLDTSLSGDANAEWYISREVFPQEMSLDSLIQADEYQRDESKVDRLMKTGDMSIFKSLYKYVQVLLFEQAWNGEICNKDIAKKIKKAMTVYKIDGNIYHILSAEPLIKAGGNATAIVIENPDNIREFKDGKWIYFHGNTDDLITKIKESAKEQIKELEEEANEYGLYARYDKDQFKIIKIGRGRGRRADLFPLAEQREFFKILGEKPVKNFDSLDKNERAQLLEDLFKKKNLIR